MILTQPPSTVWSTRREQEAGDEVCHFGSVSGLREGRSLAASEQGRDKSDGAGQIK